VSDKYRSVKYDVVSRVAYHGGQETGSVSVGSSAKGRGSPKDWAGGERGGADASSVRHHKRDLPAVSNQGSPAGEK
jgi:hypothetical protein